MKKIFLLIILLSLLLFYSSNYQNKPALQEDKPNIIFILADDLGYGDIGVYGQNKIKTPVINQLAKEGAMFTRFYAGGPVCSPSRCVLMTGKHTGNAYLRANTRQPIPNDEITIAELLKNNGYKTAMCGKWSLGLNGSSGDPAYQGFDEFIGYSNQGEAHFYYPDSIDKIVSGVSVKVPVDDNQYTHDIFIDSALQFVKKHKNNPFFIYLPVCIPHAELLVPEKDLRPYLNENGESIFDEVPFPGGHYAKQDMPRATYAAMVSKLDYDIGRIVNLLKELNIDKNTYVFFTSDNGPHMAGGNNYSYFNGNGDLRGAKGSLYEGGIRVPLIAWAPGRIPKGVINDTPWAFWDILPTVSDLTSSEIPDKIDGIAHSNLLHNRFQQQKHNYLYWEYKARTKNGVMCQQAVLKDDFKLVKTLLGDAETFYELFNLKVDINESNNIIDIYPEIASELKSTINTATTKPKNPEFFDFTKFR